MRLPFLEGLHFRFGSCVLVWWSVASVPVVWRGFRLESFSSVVSLLLPSVRLVWRAFRLVSLSSVVWLLLTSVLLLWRLVPFGSVVWLLVASILLIWRGFHWYLSVPSFGCFWSLVLICRGFCFVPFGSVVYGLCSARMAQFPLDTFQFRRLVASDFGCWFPLFGLFGAVPAWYLSVPSFGCFWPLFCSFGAVRLVPFNSVVWLLLASVLLVWRGSR